MDCYKNLFPQDDVDNQPTEDLDPSKLERTEEPLAEAIHFLKPLQSLAPQRIQTHLMAFEIYLRKGKPLLMLQVLRKLFWCLSHKNLKLRKYKARGTGEALKVRQWKLCKRCLDALLFRNNFGDYLLTLLLQLVILSFKCGKFSWFFRVFSYLSLSLVKMFYNDLGFYQINIVLMREIVLTQWSQ